MRRKADVFAKLMSKLCRTKKYVGKCVAVIKDKVVVAVGKDRYEAYQKAKKKFPEEKLGVYYVPTAEEAVTVLCNIIIQK